MNQPLIQHAIAAHQSGDTARAADLYAQALAANANDIDALNLLGSIRHQQGNSSEGVRLISRALQIEPNNPPAWYNLGLIYLDHRKWREAAAAFNEGAKHAPTRADFWLMMARAYAHQGEHAAARIAAEQAARLAAATGQDVMRRDAFLLVSGANRALNDPERQWNWGYLHTQLAPDDAESWLQLARMALAHSEYILAETLLTKAEALAPERFDIKWFRTFSLPLPIYSSEHQIATQVARYTQSVRGLHAFMKTLHPADLTGADALIDMAHPLFLAYTGVNVIEAQRACGALYSDLMAQLYGAALPARPARGKIHLAFVSETFHYHSNMKLRRSWLARLDRSKYHVTCYHVGRIADPYTEQIRGMVDTFHHFPENFHATLQQLRADAPDIIQYTNVGLKPLTIKLAALRLAPIQCTTWGHPITSGLPTMDYYLSSELMEPADAESHYTERLAVLPGLSVVPQPIFNVPDRQFKAMTRADFGLTNDDMMYLCLQSVQKYLPQDDGIYAAIAAQVPNAKFVFVQHAENAAITELFKMRITAPFLAMGLNPEAHVIMLPFQDQDGYRALHMLADVTLDSLGWSGANTTFEGLELGGLIITCAGQFMRGRHTSGCLQLMGVPELITETPEHYVALAIALARDPARRQQLREKLRAALPTLHADPGVGEALNSFYSEVFSAQN